MSVKLTHVSRYYGAQAAVDDISFDIHPGEVVGFLGPNGAGKTTTMRMITAYLKPDSGKIEVCGHDVVRDSLAVKRITGYLPEQNPLYPDLYVREYLRWMADIHHLGKRGRQRVEEVIGLTGLGKESHKKIGMLSKGYRQRVGLAQALLHDPEVLILDEPTSGLDPNQIVDIRQLIRELGRQKTVILSTHILQEVEAMCQRVIIIHRGKIVADGDIEALRQQAIAQQVLEVEWAETLAEDWWQDVPGIQQARAHTPHQWQLIAADAEELKKNLFRYALQNNLNIISLQTQMRSLEEVFRQLTQI
ncbi:gliding motility-associated ABC transporter ATP-binding subunit GldA [Thermoflavifilum thermophilum]|uniref:ABC-2 type transport system ATP-binding protein n=1 Tax=Thermoflavifilum thermophilum TaxID=1393122 RepID=A0A1I7N658_9BACT|nr:gliding motility-associated ABC transporter ATP-binding subunit GldA [Thermoflavifilum thermophilum]SFV30155.1 ABC-2 type transport system ATP-binding protein [Thermoflavifilum thermophilum]